MPRRKRDPDATREQLLEAAAALFNRDGYFRTDSNKVARAAGYAPGSFYQHFADKRACFLAVYERWVDTEWEAIGRILDEEKAPARQIVRTVVEHHKKWRVLRASLRALAATDEEVRAFQREQRRRQLSLMKGRRRADDLLLLLTMERAADAIAEGEPADVGVSERALAAVLEEAIARRLSV